ncbi:MAG: hypothetical protein FD188_3573 [Ignavibacteria bacterium]|nr:MAG: hypothetical protein FD188_3573 [Ignavibacteria bacterium]
MGFSFLVNGTPIFEESCLCESDHLVELFESTEMGKLI